jgi:predicted ferric reductase
MPLLIAAVVYWVRVMRQPIDPRLKRRHVGGFLIMAIGVVLVGLWVRQRPEPSNGWFWGEVLGVLAVYVLCWSLVLATRVRVLEPWFGGLDRMYLWHRRTAVVGFLLLVPHVFLVRTAAGQSMSQIGNGLGVLALFGLAALVIISLSRVAHLIRLAYEPWLLIHRTTGLFVAAAVVHGALVDPLLRASAPLQVTYLIIGGIGLLAYVYQELVARLIARPGAYVVRQVERLAGETLDVTLDAVTAPIAVRPGQFLFVSFGGADAWQRHPFSVAGVAADGSLRLSIRALGDYTRALYARLEAGAAARISGPYGLFDYTLGGALQVWIAAGSGVAPFLSWLRQPAGLAGRSIDFYYSVRTQADALYLDEIQAVAAREPGLRVHLIVTTTQGRLTVEQIQRDTIGRLVDTHVFLCGPLAMTESFTRGLHAVGVPRDQIHSEHFAFR